MLACRRASLNAGLVAILCLDALIGSARAHGGERKDRNCSSAEITADDRAAIRALDAKFVQGWLDDDVDAVLSVYASDPALFPPGAEPLRGLAAIRSYWWPQDGSHTRITRFEHRIEEIEGTRHLAFLRGTASLSWTYEKDGQKTSQTSRSTDVFLLTRDADGRWRITRQIWNVVPN